MCRLRKGEGLLEEVSLVLCLERWVESRAVETVELAGEGILGRRNSVGQVMKKCRCAGNCKLVQEVRMQGE